MVFCSKKKKKISTKQCDLLLIGSSPCGDMDLWQQTGESQFHRVVWEEFGESFLVHQGTLVLGQADCNYKLKFYINTSPKSK